MAVLAALFTVIETRSAHPLVPFGIFRSASLRRAQVGAVTLFGSYAAVGDPAGRRVRVRLLRAHGRRGGAPAREPDVTGLLMAEAYAADPGLDDLEV